MCLGRQINSTVSPASAGWHRRESLRPRHTLEPLAWHWSHWTGRLVNRGGGGLCRKGSNPVVCQVLREGGLSIEEELLSRNVEHFRGGLVSKAHVLLYHPDLDSSNKAEEEVGVGEHLRHHDHESLHGALASAGGQSHGLVEVRRVRHLRRRQRVDLPAPKYCQAEIFADRTAKIELRV